MLDRTLQPVYAVSTPSVRHVATRYAALVTVRRAALSALMAATLAVRPTALNAQAPAPAANPPGTIKFVKGRILVGPKAGLSTAELDKILAVHGARRVKHMPEINVHVIELPAQANEMAVIKALQANPHIKFAELDYLLDPSPGVNDPSFSSEWHLPNIAVPAAWDTRTGGGVTIAILDSGVGTTHPDLEAQLVPGWNAYDNNSDTSDVFGHGTQVAGTAAAAGNNSIGVAGVAFGAKIMPIRVTDTSGMGYASSMANGLTWAADKGARVANLSFQGISGSSTVLSAAQYFRSKNGVVVNSAGNAGTSGSVAVTIANDTVLPVVAIQSHADGSTVSGSVAVSVAATDNKNVAEIILSIDGKQVAAACSSSLSYTWSTGSTATKGKKTATTTLVSHTLTAVAKDASGNQASRSIVVKSQ